MEVLPGVYRLKVPVPGAGPGYLNTYLVRSDEGSLLIDTGWNTDEAFAALSSQLAEVGVSFADLRYIVITHVHPDHYGLVGRLTTLTDAKLILHRREQALLQSRYVQLDDLLQQMDDWLRINGVPEDARPTLQRASLSILGMVAVAMPSQVVRGGEHVRVGAFDLEILWTPGHSIGHICLYDRSRRILFSGDHVLPDTTPNVSMHVQSGSSPLEDYLAALQRVAELPVDLVLPSHGEPFPDLPRRVEELRRHHAERNRALLAAFGNQPRTACEIAALIPWTRNAVGWSTLSPFDKRMAVTETLSHLELLHREGSLGKTMRGDIVYYVPR